MRIVPAPPAPAAVGPLRHGFGIASLDAALGGGLQHGRIHEIYAAEPNDAAAAAGFAVALSAGFGGEARAGFWLRSGRAAQRGGVLQANGLAELGSAPGSGLLAVAPDATALLRAAVDALRCPAVGVVVVESWGATRELDLTASRRLALAAERSGVPLLLLRLDARPVPSAAQTRWEVAAAPSRALPGNAPGWPTFDVKLLRQKSGPCGLEWRLEWDRDRRIFRQAPLSGAVVSVPAERAVADPAGGLPAGGQRAA